MSSCDNPHADRITATTAGTFTCASTRRSNGESSTHAGSGATSSAARAHPAHNGSPRSLSWPFRHAWQVTT
jgi:hypothetical protein